MTSIAIRMGSSKSKHNGEFADEYMKEKIKQTMSIGIHFNVLIDLSDSEVFETELSHNPHMTKRIQTMIRTFRNLKEGDILYAIYKKNLIYYKLRVTRPYYFDNNVIWNWPTSSGGFFHRVGIEILEDYSKKPIVKSKNFSISTVSHTTINI